MRCVALVLGASALALGAAGCLGGGGEDDRERLEGYVERANQVQRASFPELSRANAVYRRFSAGRLETEGADTELRRAERAIRTTRERLAGLEPPAEAVRLHGRLLRYYDLNLGIARETTQLVRYLPAVAAALRPIPRASRRLSRRLRSADGPGGQVRALSLYGSALGKSLRRLRGLRPPPVVTATHRARIRQFESVRSLAGRLRRAIAGRDAPEVARLLLRFRRRQADAGPSPGLDRRALRAYARRYEAIGDQAALVRREEGRLQRDLLQ